MAGTSVGATTVEVYLSLAEFQKECRVNEEKIEASVDLSKEKPSLKNSHQRTWNGSNKQHNPAAHKKNYDLWSETSLTKKASRKELSLFETDLKKLLSIKLNSSSLKRLYH